MNIPEPWSTRIVKVAVIATFFTLLFVFESPDEKEPKATDIWKGAPSPTATQVAGMDITLPKGWQVIWEDSRPNTPRSVIIAKPGTCDVGVSLELVDFCTQYVRIIRTSVEEDDILSVFDPLVDQCRPVTRFERKPDMAISGATFAYFEARCASGPGGKPLVAQAWSAPTRAIYITALNADVPAKQTFAGARF